MSEKPLYKEINKTIKMFRNGELGLKEIFEEQVKNPKKRYDVCSINITLEYLTDYGYITKYGTDDYKLTNNGKILQNNLKQRLYRLELFIKDYPTILGGLLGGIIGTLLTILANTLLKT